jgi:hypothetical protein
MGMSMTSGPVSNNDSHKGEKSNKYLKFNINNVTYKSINNSELNGKWGLE